jgi:Galactosyltransferase
MKILIAVESCVTNRYLHQAMLDTWLGALSIMDVDCRFFIGGINEPENHLEVWVPCLDTYDNLAVKTRGICRWAAKQDYDFLFKCDTDTVVNPKRLLNSGFEKYSYMGGFNEDKMPKTLNFPTLEIQFASGGAGYWLNREAMNIIAKGLVTSSPAEDVYVAGELFMEKIFPTWHEGYRWRPGSKIEGATTFHLSSALQVKYRPELMYEYFEKILLDK